MPHIYALSVHSVIHIKTVYQEHNLLCKITCISKINVSANKKTIFLLTSVNSNSLNFTMQTLTTECMMITSKINKF